MSKDLSRLKKLLKLMTQYKAYSVTLADGTSVRLDLSPTAAPLSSSGAPASYELPQEDLRMSPEEVESRLLNLGDL